MSRRFQISLRALLVAVLAMAAFFGGIAFERHFGRKPRFIFAGSSRSMPGPHPPLPPHRDGDILLFD